MKEFDKHLVVLKCNCNGNLCTGWAVIAIDKMLIKIHKELYQKGNNK